MTILIAAVAAAGALELPQEVQKPGEGNGNGEGGSPAAAEYIGSSGQLSVASPSLPEADIVIDGELGEAAWESAALLTGFTQFDPAEGVTATQRTEARILVTPDAIYFGVMAYDNEAGGVRGTLGDRDSFAFSDDYVRFILDTYDDQRRAYVIMVNPLGVQQDGLWNVGGGGGRRGRMGPPIDWNPDFVWESSGQVHDWGYSIEVKLPLKSIKFSGAEVQDWGLQVERRIARNGYNESWAPVSANVANRLELSGKLTGLTDLDPGRLMEFNPVQTYSQASVYSDEVGGLERGKVVRDFGVNLTYGITSNLTLDGTYNPDFSQVEADAGQIVVNERFAIFLPEKRPFFLEGTEIFQLPQQLVYTRSIVNPVAGAKMQGKIGAVNAGYLGAVDDVADPDGNAENARPVVNIFRLRRDIGNSNLGMVYTDRTFHGDRYNRVVGVDGRFQVDQRYTLTMLAARSTTALGEPGAVGGSLFSAQFQRSGRSLQFEGSVQDVSDDFVAGSGFLRRTGFSQVQGRISYNFRGRPGDLLERWGPSLEAEGTWDHDDFWQRQWAEERRVRLGGSMSFRGNVTIFGNYSRAWYEFPAEDYQGLFVPGPGGGREPFLPDQMIFQGLNSGTAFMWVTPMAWLRINLRGTWSETPLFDFITDTPVDIADSWSGDTGVNLFPTTQLSAELGVRFSRLYRQRDGSIYSEATIPRGRIQYQFSRALFVRTIVEYGSQDRGRLLAPTDGEQVSYCSGDSCFGLGGSGANDISIEALVSYEPTPGTVFFLGYTRQMDDPEAFRFRNVRPQSEGVFMKLSYRFRG
ncbi:MAG: DUF5916 domain-containing protein [Gemmatimonadetes bacterium]|nr:DUF5916 domain-containing protein [Gemmatimonadota bacterium]